MRPIRTPMATDVNIGPIGSTLPPLPFHKETNEHGVTAVFSVWTLSSSERARIAAGGNILLGIFEDPAPVASLGVVEGPDFSDIGGVDVFTPAGTES